ncbi:MULTISPECIES: AzlC family ABC transporter permease [Vibrio]|uniref:Branched-chain amino acid ABC transporter permease n=1 Tax=Vibrio bivalvicida TaxID=1276888 RepID=A0A177XXR5_9VIBR|nr:MULTISPECIES: AzlC family ABC transporter permease [Vibrio]KLN66764.1 branched-chain amino acid ABC transporter permease [Vibrio sp. VPAP30]OAJ93373.1 branched-chain amino acid ABC transporter permease [Vibrio bivalvicida]
MNTMTFEHNIQLSRSKLFWQGTLAMVPLSIAVIPWGLLAGSFAIESGLTVLESQALSAILFAGSAQLVATGMFKAGATLATMLLAAFFITSRHLLYSVSMRDKVSPLPLKWRLCLGFLLTDELFAICGQQSEQQFNRWYALGAGLSFYLCWNLATLAGIVAGSYIPALNELGLEFAVAATFIAIVAPNVKSSPVLLAVVVSLVTSVICYAQGVESGLMIASIAGMLAGYVAETLNRANQ